MSACCNPVVLPWTQDQYRMLNTGNERQRDWVLNDLTRIPMKEGYAAHPHMRGHQLADESGEDMQPVFYRCRHYDEAANRCMDYDNRPDVCRGYPRYGASRMNPAAVLPPSCSFVRDLGRTPEVRVRIR